MILYVLKVSACLGLFIAFYHLVLEREKMHQFNRFYLLGCIPFSFLVPFYTMYTKAIENDTLTVSQININQSEIIEQNQFDYTNVLIGIYLIISALFLVRFLKNLFSIISLINKNSKLKINKAILVLIEDKISPHTFWNYIFVNKKEHINAEIEKELYDHELTHATQKHTLDIILIELFQIIFWINPLIILLKKAIKLNHEFIADNSVIKTYKNIPKYQYLLLNKSSWKNEYYLASNLNYVLTKKRLLMMNKQSSHRKIILKKLAIVPLLLTFVLLFSKKVSAKEYNKPLIENFKTSTDSIPNRFETGFYDKNQQTLYYIKNDEGTRYFNRFGQLVDKNGKILNNETTLSDEVIPDHIIEKVYKNGKVVSEFKRKGSPNPMVVKKGDITNIPPPPKPKSPTVKEMDITNIPPPPKPIPPAVKKGEISNIPPPPKPLELIHNNKDATFYFNDKKVSYRKIQSLIKNQKGLHLLSKEKGDKKIIKFSTKEYAQNKKKHASKKVENVIPKHIDADIYLDGKIITQEEAKKLDVDKIAKIDIRKNKKGKDRIYITSK